MCVLSLTRVLPGRLNRRTIIDHECLVRANAISPLMIQVADATILVAACEADHGLPNASCVTRLATWFDVCSIYIIAI
jgi:hypothetical protein